MEFTESIEFPTFSYFYKKEYYPNIREYVCGGRMFRVALFSYGTSEFMEVYHLLYNGKIQYLFTYPFDSLSENVLKFELDTFTDSCGTKNRILLNLRGNFTYIYSVPSTLSVRTISFIQ